MTRSPAVLDDGQVLALFQLRSAERVVLLGGEVEIDEWKCLAELIGSAFDDFNEIMIIVILERSCDDIDSYCVPASSPPRFETASLPSCHIS